MVMSTEKILIQGYELPLNRSSFLVSLAVIEFRTVDAYSSLIIIILILILIIIIICPVCDSVHSQMRYIE
jgi:hypothetical protein